MNVKIETSSILKNGVLKKSFLNMLTYVFPTTKPELINPHNTPINIEVKSDSKPGAAYDISPKFNGEEFKIQLSNYP